MKARILAALAAIALPALQGCTSHGSSVYAAVENNLDSRPAIIFIPGFYGSALRMKGAGRRVFLTGMQAYFGTDALSLFQDQLATPHGPELEVEGVLGAVPVIPGLYEINVYGPLIQRLRQIRPDAQVIPFAYDWREDLLDSVGRLDETVKLLQSKGCKSISIVSHSMGGLIATYYLAYGSQPLAAGQINWAGAKSVSKAVFFGTPFSGSMIAFRSFEKGSGLPHSEKLLPADAMSSFPSMYEMLPGMATLYDKAGAKLSVDLFDAELWRKNHFGLLRRDTLPASFLESRGRFTSEWLAKGHRWNDLVQLGRSAAWQPPEDFRVLNIVGSRHDTLNSGYLDAASGKLLFDPKEVAAAGLKMEPLYQNGDGTVTMSSSQVPASLESVTKQVVVESPHDQLFLDPAADKEYKVFLEAPTAAKP